MKFKSEYLAKSLFFFLMAIPSMLFSQEDAYNSGIKTMLNTKYGLTGGEWVFNPNEASNATEIGSLGGEKKILDVTDQPFTKAIQLTVSTLPKKVWEANLQLISNQPVQKDDKILLIFYAKAISGINNTVLANFFFQRNEAPWKKYSPLEQLIGNEWKQYIIPITINTDIAMGKSKFMVEMGAAKQTIQIGGIAAINYKQAYPITALPVQSNDQYQGMEANAPWRKEAKERIEKNRKANLNVEILDASNKPLSNVKVKIEMLRHSYPFGTAINEGMVHQKNTNNKYREMLLNLDGKGHGFNEVVFENGHKWKAWDENYSSGSKEEKVEIIKWFTDRNIPVRGHTLLWPGWSNSPAHLQGLKTDLQGLKASIFNHIEEKMNYPGIKGIITDWDVLNEFTGNNDIANTFKGSPGYPTGREIYTEVFNFIDKIAPNTKKYVNEAHLTNIYVDENLFKSYVKQMIAEGSKGVNIGFQAHFRYMIPPEEWYKQMDEYHNITGGLVKITEFDNKTFASSALEGNYLRDILTMHFSYPYSDGFIMWGFWDGAHYSGRAPLFDRNWNLKPQGKPFIDLVFGEWWTPTTTLNSNAQGTASQRGFKGDYKITITDGTNTFEEVVPLNADMKITYKKPFTKGVISGGK